MYLLQKDKFYKKYISISILLVGVVACRPKDPVRLNNRAFLYEHGDEVQKAKAKNKQIVAISDKGSLEERKRVKVPTQTKKEKRYVEDYDYNANEYYNKLYGDRKVDYVNYNSNVYREDDVNFDDIKIPRQDVFEDKTLGEKDFESVDNETMQKSFDRMNVIQKKRERDLRKLKAKQNKIQKTEKVEAEKKESILGKAKKTIKSFKDKVLELLK